LPILNVCVMKVDSQFTGIPVESLFTKCLLLAGLFGS
jgi:hypothetical protein